VVLGDLLGDLSSSWGSSWVSVLLSLGYLHSHERMRAAEVHTVHDLSHEWDSSVHLSVHMVVSSNSVHLNLMVPVSLDRHSCNLAVKEAESTCMVNSI
jgi:hypothetical protein